MENDNIFILNLKTGIFKELYDKQLITKKQMEATINILYKKDLHKNDLYKKGGIK